MGIQLRGSIIFKMLIFVLFLSAIIYMSRKASDLKGADEAKSSSDLQNANSPVEEAVKEVINLDVYYEALCPDSKNFIVRQVGPTYEKLHEIIDLNFIPYGKASTKKTADGYEFDCQHGPPECNANKFHACAVKQLDTKISVPLVVCLMEHNYDTKSGLTKCAKKLGISSSEIDSCAEGNEGNHLLYLFGELTHDLSPAVYFITTVEI
jgi:interferon gamma-inducible protein 30